MLARSSDNSFCSLQLYDTQSHNFSSAKRATDHAPGHRNRASLYRTTAIRLNEDSNLLAVGTASGKRRGCGCPATSKKPHNSLLYSQTNMQGACTCGALRDPLTWRSNHSCAALVATVLPLQLLLPPLVVVHVMPHLLTLAML